MKKKGGGGGGAAAFTLDDIEPIEELPDDPAANSAFHDDIFNTSLGSSIETFGLDTSFTLDEVVGGHVGGMAEFTLDLSLDDDDDDTGGALN